MINIIITPTPPISPSPIVPASTSVSGSPPIAPIAAPAIAAPVIPRQTARSAAVVFGFVVAIIFSPAAGIVGMSSSLAGPLPIGLLAALAATLPIIVVIAASVVVSPVVLAIAPPIVHWNYQCRRCQRPGNDQHKLSSMFNSLPVNVNKCGPGRNEGRRRPFNLGWLGGVRPFGFALLLAASDKRIFRREISGTTCAANQKICA